MFRPQRVDGCQPSLMAIGTTLVEHLTSTPEEDIVGVIIAANTLNRRDKNGNFFRKYDLWEFHVCPCADLRN